MYPTAKGSKDLGEDRNTSILLKVLNESPLHRFLFVSLHQIRE